jgi:hypothetical protein
MFIEKIINYQLNKYPSVKKHIKRAYQLVMYVILPKIVSVGNIERVSPNTKCEYFFGYYDKSPWDSSMRYVICMRADNTWSTADPIDTADILLIDTQNNNAEKLVATTHTWNVQQGCMAQWLGPDFSKRIIYNDLRDRKYCSVVKNIVTKEEQILPIPVYSVSSDGKTALSLDFFRLHSLRLGYGYAAIPEITKGVALPDSTAVWKLDIESGVVTELLKYTDFVKFQPRTEMQEAGSVHKLTI